MSYAMNTSTLRWPDLANIEYCVYVYLSRRPPIVVPAHSSLTVTELNSIHNL